MIIIATKELIKKKPEFQHEILADINNLDQFHKDILKIKETTEEIKIYDIGKVFQKQQNTVKIKDHINKTGINPIINNKHINKIQFQDIRELYNTNKGAITTCCGEKINSTHKNPSHFLCVFSILLFYLGYKTLQAYIVQYDTV